MDPLDQQPLAYFQPSPVRGQLEPADPTTKPGWRYLQCTDTPNELKVLLPPRTSQVYAYLLGQEKRELQKGPDAAWELLLHIRHLKDRMIRKCTRLSRLSTVRHTTDVGFRTIHAPPDFMLKELEKWYKHRHDTDNIPSSYRRTTPARPRSPVATRKTGVTAKHSHGTRATNSYSRTQRVTHASVSRRSSGSNLTQSSDNRYERRDSDLYYDDKTLPSVPGDDSFVHVRHSQVPQIPEAGPYRGARDEHGERFNLTSPDPLPHPYRPRDSVVSESEQPAVPFPVPQTYGSPDPTFPVPMPAPVPGLSIDGILDEASLLERPGLHRKRSSLKRSSSRLSNKSVAWVDQQKSRYESAVEDIEVAGDELDLARAAHRDEILLLHDLHRNVGEIKERLRLDEERIRMERERLIGAEETVRHQEERLRTTFEQLEIQEGRYQTKVNTILEETQRTLFSKREERILEES